MTDGYLRPIVLLALASFASAATTRITDPILPQLADAYGVGIATVSMVATGYSLTYGCSQVFFGPVGDRYGKFRIILFACLGSALSNTLCGVATSLAMLEAARLVSGLAAACIVPLSIAWIGDAIPYARRQGVLAGFITGQISGVLAGQAVGGLLGGAFGWRFVFLALSAVFAVVAIGLLAELVVNRAARPAAAVPRSFLAGLGATFALVGRRDLRRLLLAVGIEGFAVFGPLTFVGAEMKARFGLSFTAVGLMLSAYALGGLVYAVSARRLVGALGQARLAFAGAIVVALAMMVIALAASEIVAFAGIAAIGLGFYMMHNTLQTVATQVAPEARGAAVSLFATCFFVSQAAGVFVGGRLLEGAGGPVLFAGAAAIVVVLGGGIYLWLRRWRLTELS
ncbi:MAG: MFS transporter [Xanthobacteraceae bacterium]|nr:MFS transporter [Xanthobacteraceae bacterium]